jgi:hypothetical protein
MSRQILTPVPYLDNLFIIQITISFMILDVSLMNNMKKNYLHKIILSLTHNFPVDQSPQPGRRQKLTFKTCIPRDPRCR